MAGRDKPRGVIWGGLLLLASIVIVVTYVKPKNRENVLHTIFPVGTLKPDGTLLDPANTDSVWHYYLLENLAVGLVRDDVRAPTGFQGVLVSGWAQSSPTQWRFELR